MSLALLIPVGISITACTVAAWTDIRTGRIPNWLTLTLLPVAFGIGTLQAGWQGLVTSIVGALVTALVPLILFRLGAMGGGDVKLFAALGALLGAGVGLETQMAAFMIGGIQGIILWLRRGQIRQGIGQTLGLFVPRVFRRHGSEIKDSPGRAEIRLGPAILAGLLVACTARLMG